MSEQLPNPKQVRFNCRRGMGELEDVLYPFFDNHYEILTDQEKHGFVQLLAAEDTELWEWLVTKESQPPTDLASIVDKINNAA